jgi:two-component system, NarL family, sensor kinase
MTHRYGDARRRPRSQATDRVTERWSPLEGGLLHAVRCFAVIRLLFIAVALITHATVPIGSRQPSHFHEVAMLGTAYALVLLALAARRPGPLLAWRRLGLVDLALVTGLVVYTGGPESPLRYALCALPFLVAFVARPAAVALWSLSMLAWFVAIRHALPFPRGHDFDPAILPEAAGLVFVFLAAIAFSAVLDRHGRMAIKLAKDIVRAEDRERRKLADALHAGAVQEIAVGSREVAAALRGDDACLEAARTALDTALGQLRGEIFDLDPHVLDYGDLAAAVGQLVDRQAERGGFTSTIDVDPAAIGVDDVTVMSVLRELLSNVVKHAGAGHVDVRVANEAGSSLVVAVRDDGRGFDPPSLQQAERAQHFGLQSATKRLRALGGSLDVSSAPGQGTAASARIPIARAA